MYSGCGEKAKAWQVGEAYLQGRRSVEWGGKDGGLLTITNYPISAFLEQLITETVGQTRKQTSSHPSFSALPINCDKYHRNPLRIVKCFKRSTCCNFYGWDIWCFAVWTLISVILRKLPRRRHQYFKDIRVDVNTLSLGEKGIDFSCFNTLF